MTLERWYLWLILGWVALAALTCALLWFVPAPYGRHGRRGWGPVLQPSRGWLIMEAPAPIVVGLAFLLSGPSWSAAQMAFIGMWEFHYVYRAFIYPQRLAARGRVSWSIVAMGFAFNLVNGFVNGYELFLAPSWRDAGWLGRPVFWLGLALFALGLGVNRRAHRTLGQLRTETSASYMIPRGGLYDWVSSPNYLGEIVQWIGWALATCSLAGLSFALWTMANLVPRASANHAWYRGHFPDYPVNRRALIPRVW